jgi:F-type H+-transporting ATPase subunit a
MRLTPDDLVIAEWGPFALNATIVWTWAIDALLVLVCWRVSRRLGASPRIGRWQNALEVIVAQIRKQIRDSTEDDPERYLPFLGTLFLFIATSNALAIVPYYEPPTGSLATTAALALCVFVAAPAYGIASQGLGPYLRGFIEPTPLMLPFNIVGELSRTLALAVRLFGNIMSGTFIVGLMVALAPFLFPVVMRLFGLLTGLIQAYIFAVLAAVYIASATRAHSRPPDSTAEPGGSGAATP